MLFSSTLFAQSVQIQIDPTRTYQTINGFAASDCWTGNYVGQYWSDPVKERIAKYLFSQNFSYNGSPEGIGLSMWRVNLGAGTYEQGDLSDITDISRRAECFLDASGNYDWTKQAGQQYFMTKAKEYGCEKFVGFSNSPLVIYTRNGKGYANGDGYSNLRTDKYDDYANYLADVAKHFEDIGMPFSYISPLNEPQYDWKDPGQEGSPWQNNEIKKMVSSLDQAITNKNIKTKILIPEAGNWNYLYQSSGRATNEIYEFFDRRSGNYIGNLPSVEPAIAAHSYWTHYNNTVIENSRTNAKINARKYDLKTYQTEWSLLSNAVGVTDSSSYMDIALFMAKIIYSDLAYANVSSWSFWTSMDMERWNHKDRFLLLALEPGGSFYNPVTMSGNVYDRSTLWVLGNYSFFIRPGYKRIKLIGADDLNGLMGTAYLSNDSDKIVAVYVNMAYETKSIATEFINMTATPISNKRYVTSSMYNLRKYGSSTSDVYDSTKELSIPARSVMTIVYELNKDTGIKSVTDQKDFSAYPNPIKSGQSLQIKIPERIEFQKGIVSIYSMDGRLKYSLNVASTSNILDIKIPDSLKAGIYYITIQTSQTLLKNKLVVN